MAPAAHSIGPAAAHYLLPDLAAMLAAATLIYCLFLYGAGEKLFRDSDTGWHIRNGESILANRALPHTDPYSFSKSGQPWVSWEWGSDVLMGFAHRIGGLRALTALFSLTISASIVAMVQVELCSRWRLPAHRSVCAPDDHHHQRSLAGAPAHIQLDLPARRVALCRVGQAVLPASRFQPALAGSRCIRLMGQPARQLLPLSGNRADLCRIALSTPVAMATRRQRRARQGVLVPLRGAGGAGRKLRESLRLAVARARISIPSQRPVDRADRRVSILQFP